MRLVVQRVARAEVRSAGTTLGRIGPGAAVLIGVAPEDSPQISERMADKLIGLRYFEDDDGRTNRPIVDAGGAFLVVSQFTLYADIARGRRPGFTRAAPTDVAEPIVERFVESLRSAGVEVQTGRFGAAMELEVVNDGPFTLIVDSDRDLPPEAG